jgi:glycosyltransferase involved in cell wall biosynthesis
MKENHHSIYVAYVIDSLALRGAQRALIYLVQGLSQRNYQQRVYSLNNIVHPDNKNALLECGVEVKVIGRLQLLTTIGLIRIVYDWIRWKPDIVFTMLFHSDVIGRTAAKISSVPIIISSIRAKNIDKRGFQFYLDRLTARWADKVVFNSKRGIPFAIQHEGIREEQVVYIPNGVNIRDDKIHQDKKREELGISKNTLIIGSVGRLALQKGYAYLLQAFQIIQRQIPNSVLLIIGRGGLLGRLQALSTELYISNKVKFLGERTDIDELLACMDVYVQSSVFEGMPNALMEAMAAGKAVVATAVDGTCELIEDGETGWFVESEKPEMLAEKICYVLKHPEIAGKVGLAATERMAKDFSLEKMTNSYDMVFRELLAEKLGSIYS